MQTPPALDLPVALAGGASAQSQSLRLPAAAWSALLSALALDPQETSLPGTATVVARAPGNSYQIEYARRMASIAWPQPLAVGSAVRLVPAAVPAPPPAAAAPADSAQVGESIPALARLIDGVLRDPPAPLALRLGTPLTAASNAHAAPQHFAAALAEAVARSGAFFESHLADWARGARDTAPLLAEAQSRANALASAPDPAGDVALRQQLCSLATGEFTFRFPAWPGQHATLVVGREPEQAPEDAPCERTFRARLELDLPCLGSVRATLKLDARGIDVDLRTAMPDAARTLGAGRESLAHAFAAANLWPQRIEVRHASA